MWILPNNHQLSSVFAQEYVDSKEDLKEYFTQSEPPFLWKSKPLLWKTFLQQWKKVWWLRHLSGRILKPSTRTRFETALRELLEDTPVSLLVTQEAVREQMTLGTCGHSFDDVLRSLDQAGVFSKMLQDTLRWDSILSSENWKKWATSLRLVYTQRKKLVRLTAGSDSLFLPSDLMWLTPRVMEAQESYETYLKRMQASPDPKNNTKTRPGNLSMQVQMSTGKMWTTPVAHDAGNRSTKYAQGGTPLPVQAKQWGTPRISTNGMIGQANPTKGSRIEDQVLNWPTPVTTDAMEPKTEKAILRELTETRPGRTSFSNLRDAAVRGLMSNWTTPNSRDWKDTAGMNWVRKDGRSKVDQLPRQVYFLLDKASINTHGKNPVRLNPGWSIQLMGTTLPKIFTVPLVILSSSKQPSSLFETFPVKSTDGSNMLMDDDWVNT